MRHFLKIWSGFQNKVISDSRSCKQQDAYFEYFVDESKQLIDPRLNFIQ